MDTLQSAIRPTKITTTQKQRVLDLTGGRGGRGGRGGEVTISKINDDKRVDVGDVEHVGGVAVQINVCDVTTRETHPMELIGWRISSLNQGFMQFFQQKKRPGYMN